mgnify:CR=1 FL=1
MGTVSTIAVSLGSYLAKLERPDVPKEVLSSGEIRYLPYLASITLVGFRFLFKFFGADVVNYTFSIYVGLAGTNSIWFLLRALFPKKSRPLIRYPRSHTILTQFMFPSQPIWFCLFDIPLYAVGAFINLWYYKTRNAYVGNIIALSIAIYAIMAIRVGKFSKVWRLVFSLVIYDVVFVYLTNVMTIVATNLDGPVKLVIPRFDGYGGYSILGLGDLVYPGLFMAVCSRFDHFLYGILKKRTPYWIISIIGYVVGIVITDVFCYITQSGQPALLFLIPSIAIPVFIATIVRREYYAFASFNG